MDRKNVTAAGGDGLPVPVQQPMPLAYWKAAIEMLASMGPLTPVSLPGRSLHASLSVFPQAGTTNSDFISLQSPACCAAHRVSFHVCGGLWNACLDDALCSNLYCFGGCCWSR